MVANTLFAQTDTIRKPLDPYPISGLVYEYDSDAETVNFDTVFIGGCQVQITGDSVVIATGVTDSLGKYKIEFPVDWFANNSIFVKTNCDNYVNLESGLMVLYGIAYPAMGMRSDFALEKKE